MSEVFQLTREPAHKAKRATFTSSKTSQATLFSGLDCLPGQQDLFETDGFADGESANGKTEQRNQSFPL